MRSFFSYKTVVGLEINPFQIKLVITSKARNHVEIVHSSAENTHDQDVEAALRRLAADIQLTKLPIAIALPYTDCSTKSLPVNHDLSLKEWQMEFEQQLSHYLPGMPLQSYYDFALVETRAKKKLYLQAASPSVYQKHTQAIFRSGLSIKIIDIDAYAIIRTLEYFFPQIAKVDVRGIFFFDDVTLKFFVCDAHQVLYYAEDHVDDILMAMQHRMSDFYAHKAHLEINMTYLINLHHWIDENSFGQQSHIIPSKIKTLNFLDSIQPEFKPAFSCCFGLTLRNFARW